MTMVAWFTLVRFSMAIVSRIFRVTPRSLLALITRKLNLTPSL